MEQVNVRRDLDPRFRICPCQELLFRLDHRQQTWQGQQELFHVARCARMIYWPGLWCGYNRRRQGQRRVKQAPTNAFFDDRSQRGDRSSRADPFPTPYQSVQVYTRARANPTTSTSLLHSSTRDYWSMIANMRQGASGVQAWQSDSDYQRRTALTSFPITIVEGGATSSAMPVGSIYLPVRLLSCLCCALLHCLVSGGMGHTFYYAAGATDTHAHSLPPHPLCGTT